MFRFFKIRFGRDNKIKLGQDFSSLFCCYFYANQHRNQIYISEKNKMFSNFFWRRTFSDFQSTRARKFFKSWFSQRMMRMSEAEFESRFRIPNKLHPTLINSLNGRNRNVLFFKNLIRKNIGFHWPRKITQFFFLKLPYCLISVFHCFSKVIKKQAVFSSFMFKKFVFHLLLKR